jgi:hypothetical protein
MLTVSGLGNFTKVVARLGAAPSISSSQARRIAVFLARGHDSYRVNKMAACAGIAPATFRSTGGCSSWLS